MNRKIKFRAWDGKEMHISFLVARPQFADALSIMTDEKFALAQYEKQEWKVMQFTGLHDKNDKEIYEGDVIKIHTGALTILPNSPTFHKGVIVWNEGVCAFQYSYDAIAGRLTNTLYEFECVKYEVIGNIYENAELQTP